MIGTSPNRPRKGLVGAGKRGRGGAKTGGPKKGRRQAAKPTSEATFGQAGPPLNLTVG